MPPYLVDLLARLNRWPRRLAALSCVVLAGVSALAARRVDVVREQGNSASVRVVVAAHDLGVGTALTVRDLTTVAWPRALVPAGASGDPDRLVGRRLAGPLRKREAVTTTRLVGAELTAGLAVGEVATAVLIDAALATVLHAGDHVDILAGPSDDVPSATGTGRSATAGAILVAEALAVLAVLSSTDADGGSGSARILVVTDRGTAVRLVALQGHRVLAVVLSPP